MILHLDHLDITEQQLLRGRLDWEELKKQIYQKFFECEKSNIQTCLGCVSTIQTRFGCVSTIATALTKFFNPVLVQNLICHTFDTF